MVAEVEAVHGVLRALPCEHRSLLLGARALDRLGEHLRHPLVVTRARAERLLEVGDGGARSVPRPGEPQGDREVVGIDGGELFERGQGARRVRQPLQPSRGVEGGPAYDRRHEPGSRERRAATDGLVGRRVFEPAPILSIDQLGPLDGEGDGIGDPVEVHLHLPRSMDGGHGVEQETAPLPIHLRLVAVRAGQSPWTRRRYPSARAT